MDFLGRNKFWVGMALVGFAAILLVVLVGIPAMAANRRTKQELQSRRDTLASYANAEHVKNPTWVLELEERKKKYLAQLEQIKSYFAARDRVIEARFVDKEYPDKPLLPSRWKIVYNEMMDELEEKLQEVVRLGTASPLERVDYQDSLPSEAEMREQEKRYWLQKAIVDTIANLNAARDIVPVLYEFRILSQPDRLLSPAHGDKFRVVPWELRVALEFKNLPRLMYELLDHELGLELTEMSVSRTVTALREGGRAAPMTGQERMLRGAIPGVTTTGARMAGIPGAYMEEFMGGPMEGPLPPTMMGPPTETRPTFERPEMPGEEVREVLSKTLVEVTLRGYLPDYIEPEEAETSH